MPERDAAGPPWMRGFGRLKSLRAETGIRYDERMQGTLQLFRTQKHLDGTGAGDAFAAAFCAAWIHGATPFEAAERAVVVASEAVTRTGARPN